MPMMQLFQKIRETGPLNKWLVGLVTCLFLYTVVGFAVVPALLKWILTKKLSENLHRQVMIEDIDFNPYALSTTIKEVVVKDREGSDTFFSLGRLYTNLQLISLFKRAPIIRELRIEDLYVNIVRSADGLYNFSDLVPEDSSESQGPETESRPVSFSLNNIQLSNGRIQFVDVPKDKNHQVTDLDITAPFLSTLPYHIDSFVEPMFSAKINERPVSFKGKTKPFADSVETILEIDLDDIDIPYYLAYVPLNWKAKVVKGHLNTSATLSYMQYADGPPSLSVSGELSLKTLEVVDGQKRPLLNFPLIHVSMAPSELMSKNFHLSKVLVQSPEVHIARDPSGELSIQSIIAKSEDEKEPPRQQSPATPLTVTLDEIGVKDGGFVFSDLFVDASSETASPVTLELQGINIAAQDISTVEDTKGKVNLACQLNGKAPLSAEAVVGISPLAADVDLAVEGVQVRWLEPYFTDQIKIMVTNGTFSTVGKLTLSESSDKGLGGGYLGKAALSGFSSVDKLHADDFAKWGSLDVRDMDFGFNPSHIRIKEIALTDFYAWIIVNPDGKTNLQTIAKEKATEDEERPSPAKGETPVTPISVENITFKGGHISFLDRLVEPNYSSDLVEIKGAVSGLSSAEGAAAQVRLEGKLDNHAPIEMNGSINPLVEDLFVDLEIAFRDIDLSPMTPYAGKYVGQTIEKGKLLLDLNYLIEKRKLDSENRIFIDQLTFGNKVESADAVNLPVGLAVALLKDRNGEIHLDLPVSGHTDDPEFSVGRVIAKMLMNLLTKAATSPFSLLGAVLPGGEEFSALEFDYGSYGLTEQTKKKLDGITKVLYERPSLKLDIEGQVDVERDREGLREYLFQKKLKALKLKKSLKKGAVDISIADVTIEAGEYEKYLRKVYKAEEFEKPKNALGLARRLPVPEMETLIIKHIEVSDNDLRLLALKRAQQVKDYILQSGKIEPERVFLVETESLSSGERQQVENSGVHLGLK